MPRKTPADVVIEEFGGVCPTARAIGDVSASWVCRWRQSKELGGTGGAIPNTHHKAILTAARRLGKKITADDLVYGRYTRTQRRTAA